MSETKEGKYFWSGQSLMRNVPGTSGSDHCLKLYDGPIQPTPEEREIILDAFNVENETGLTPRQLKEQRGEPLRFVKKVSIALRNGGHGEQTEFGQLYAESEKLIEGK